MVETGHNIGIALLCRPNGTVIEVLYDDLGLTARLTPGRSFTSVVNAQSLRKTVRFLQTIRKSRSALDWLDVALPHGGASLFFFGYKTTRGTVIVGTKESLSAEALLQELTDVADESSDSLWTALRELGKRKEEEPALESGLCSQLSRLNNDLVHTQRELIRRNIELETVSIDRARLLGIAAHDLRNPISGILTASQYLLDDAASSLEAEHVALLQSIESSSRFMLRLIEDMLEISTIEFR